MRKTLLPGAVAVLLATTLALILRHGTSSDQPAGESTPAAEMSTELFGDLPQEVLDYVAAQAMATIFTEGQDLVIEQLLQEPEISAEERDALNHLAEVLARDDSGELLQLIPQVFGRGAISLVDPTNLRVRTAELRQQVDDQWSTRMIISGEQSRAADLHNLIVYYTRSVLGLCGDPVEWTPAEATGSSISSLYELVAEDNRYQRMHGYLIDFRNQPFKKRERFFTAIYFQFLELALRARDVDLPRREFVAARPDLYEQYPELEQISELLAYLVNSGLA